MLHSLSAPSFLIQSNLYPTSPKPRPPELLCFCGPTAKWDHAEPAFLHLTPWHISVAHFLSATLGLPSRAKAKMSSDLTSWGSDEVAMRNGEQVGGWHQGHTLGLCRHSATGRGKGRLEGCYFFLLSACPTQPPLPPVRQEAGANGLKVA